MEAAASDSISKLDEIAIEIREVPCSGLEHLGDLQEFTMAGLQNESYSGPGYLACDIPVQYSIPTTSASLVLDLGHCPNFHLRGLWTVVGFPIG